jgi:hypothetical protein
VTKKEMNFIKVDSFLIDLFYSLKKYYFTICLIEVQANKIRKKTKKTFAMKTGIPVKNPNASVRETIPAIRNNNARPAVSISII